MKVSDDFTRAVLIPTSQALITGLLIFLMVLGLSFVGDFPWHWAIVAGTISALFAWLLFWNWWSRVILDILVPWSEQSAVSMPESVAEAEPQTVRVEIVENKGTDLQIIDLPARPDQLTALATGLTRGDKLNMATWAGAGGVFSRNEFEKLVAEMLRRKLLRLNSPNSPQRGYALTFPGQAVMRKIAQTPPPSSQDEG